MSHIAWREILLHLKWKSLRFILFLFNQTTAAIVINTKSFMEHLCNRDYGISIKNTYHEYVSYSQLIMAVSEEMEYYHNKYQQHILHNLKHEFIFCYELKFYLHCKRLVRIFTNGFRNVCREIRINKKFLLNRQCDKWSISNTYHKLHRRYDSVKYGLIRLLMTNSKTFLGAWTSMLRHGDLDIKYSPLLSTFAVNRWGIHMEINANVEVTLPHNIFFNLLDTADMMISFHYEYDYHPSFRCLDHSETFGCLIIFHKLTAASPTFSVTLFIIKIKFAACTSWSFEHILHKKTISYTLDNKDNIDILKQFNCLIKTILSKYPLRECSMMTAKRCGFDLKKYFVQEFKTKINTIVTMAWTNNVEKWIFENISSAQIHSVFKSIVFVMDHILVKYEFENNRFKFYWSQQKYRSSNLTRVAILRLCHRFVAAYMEHDFMKFIECKDDFYHTQLFQQKSKLFPKYLGVAIPRMISIKMQFDDYHKWNLMESPVYLLYKASFCMGKYQFQEKISKWLQILMVNLLQNQISQHLCVTKLNAIFVGNAENMID